MKVKAYEYVGNNIDENIEFADERRENLITKIKSQIRRGNIALHKILEICENDEEIDYVYKWLAINDITIRGINGVLSGELENYEYIKKLGIKELPEALEEEEQQELFLQLKDCKVTNPQKYQDIREKIIVHNMRLALWAVGVKFRKSLKDLNFENADLQQIAMEGLIKAVDKYDIDLGYKFSTYAVPIIYYGILNNWRDTSKNNSFELKKEWNILEQFESETLKSINRKPTDEEIKGFLGINDERLGNLKKYINYHLQESQENLKKEDDELFISELLDDERIEEIDSKPILNGIYIDEEEMITQEQLVTPEGAAIKKSFDECLYSALYILKPREREVLELRFGLKDGQKRTLREVRK